MDEKGKHAIEFANWLYEHRWTIKLDGGRGRRDLISGGTDGMTDDALYEEFIAHGCRKEFLGIVDHYAKVVAEKVEGWSISEVEKRDAVTYMSGKISNYLEAKGRLGDNLSLKTYFSVIAKTHLFSMAYKFKKDNTLK